jgi:hypothetical protein
MAETCHQKIIEFLIDKDQSCTKEVIASHIHHTVGTTAKALSELASDEYHPKYVVEFNGKWSITGAGKELPPNFDKTYYSRPKEKNGNGSSRVFWLDQIDWDYVDNNPVCSLALEHDDWKIAPNKLLPFVLIWLKRNNIELGHSWNGIRPETNEETSREFEAVKEWFERQD